MRIEELWIRTYLCVGNHPTGSGGIHWPWSKSLVQLYSFPGRKLTSSLDSAGVQPEDTGVREWIPSSSTDPTPNLTLNSERVLENKSANQIANSGFILAVCVSACVFHCLSRIPVQRSGAGGGSGPRPGSAAAAPRAGGRQLLLPASLRPAHVHHAHPVQQKNSHQRQGQRNRGGEGRLSVSIPFSFLCIVLFWNLWLLQSKRLILCSDSINFASSCLKREHLLWVYLYGWGLCFFFFSLYNFCAVINWKPWMGEYKSIQRFWEIGMKTSNREQKTAFAFLRNEQ